MRSGAHGSLFYHDTHYSQRGSYTNLLLCDIPRNKAPCTGPHHIWCTYRLCAFFGREKNTEGTQDVWKIWLASACYADSWVSTIFAAAALGLPTNLGVGRSWLFPASSVKFRTRRSLKSRWVHLAPHEDNSIQLLSTVRSRRWKKQFHSPLEVTSIHQIAVGHTIWNVDETHVPVIPFHDVRLHRVVAVATKISFCWWWVQVSM